MDTIDFFFQECHTDVSINYSVKEKVVDFRAVQTEDHHEVDYEENPRQCLWKVEKHRYIVELLSLCLLIDDFQLKVGKGKKRKDAIRSDEKKGLLSLCKSMNAFSLCSANTPQNKN